MQKFGNDAEMEEKFHLVSRKYLYHNKHFREQ